MGNEKTQFKKGVPRPVKAGRRKGTPNKITQLTRDIISGAFDQLGGIERLVRWAGKSEKNLGDFYTKIWVRIIPLEVTGVGGGPIKFQQEERDKLRSAILEKPRPEAQAEPTRRVH